MKKQKEQLFDSWPEIYEQWFETPMGQAVLYYENKLIAEMFQPRPGQQILDAGCGTGIFTRNYLERGIAAVGLDLSFNMIQWAIKKLHPLTFSAIQGDLKRLPFRDASFHHALSVTALEFIVDAASAIQEITRVVKPNGTILIATLNVLSPWAASRTEKVRQGHDTIFRQAIFRSPEDIRSLPIPPTAQLKTAVHFLQDDPLERIASIEEEGKRREAMTGAFIACSWRKA